VPHIYVSTGGCLQVHPRGVVLRPYWRLAAPLSSFSNNQPKIVETSKSYHEQN
jgi:hypothetical protein